MYFQYEILRVFLHTGVPLMSLKTLPRRLDYNQYDTLWAYLKKLPGMAKKQFPPKSDKDVWAVALQDSPKGSQGINMSGTLQYCDPVPSSGPIFKFRLRPLKLDRTNRLERRFGGDRFLEIDIPNIAGGNLPKAVQRYSPTFKTGVIDWLMECPQMIGRTWQPFSNKLLRVIRAKKKKTGQNSRSDDTSQYRMFFFAVDGHGFSENVGTPLPDQVKTYRSKWTVDSLLNWIRPTWQNRSQSYLKLYARTPLGMSINSAML
jgi:hypothetical protein